MTYSAVMACDDGRIKRLGEGWTTLACVLWEHDSPADTLLLRVKVDGLDASSLISHAARVLGVDLVLLDSLTIAGFNVVSPSTVFKLSGARVLVVYTYKPSFQRLEKAGKRLGFWDIRRRVLELVDTAVRVDTMRGTLYIIPWGIGISESKNVIETLQVHSRLPEPLRLAHMIASEASLIANG